MDRRRFLKWGAGVSAVGAAVVGGGVAAVQPRRRVVPVRNPEAPERAPERRRVGVIGGGLAGLSAAIQLGRRGFDVHLFEAAPHLGGKLGGWEIEALGRRFPVEHGFHGFFNQYYNLWALLREAGAEPDLARVPSYPILFADRPPEHFVPSTAPFPFNLLGVLTHSESIHLRDFVGDFPGLYELMAYDEAKTFAARDDVSFAEYLRTAGVPEPMTQAVLAPFGNASMNHLERFSAAEGIRFFHVYFFGNPEGLGFRILTRDVMAAVVDRIEALAEAAGVTIHKGRAVRRLATSGGRVTDLVVEAPDAPPLDVRALPEAARFVPMAALSSRWRAHESPAGHPIYVRRAADGGAEAVLGRCTHMGCPVKPEGEGFLCPCHGGAFDAEGRVLRGPPPLPLPRLTLAPVEGGFELQPGAARVEDPKVPVDYAVLACDSVRSRELLERTGDVLDGPWARSVRQLEPADPYAILRLWLDRPTRPERAPFYSVHGYRFTDSVAIYSAFQAPYVEWAKQSGGSVVEVHAYAISPPEPYAVVRAGLLDEMRRVLPELAEARVLHEEMQLQDNFTAFPPGRHASRPGTRSDLPNLLAAGDWVRLPIPAFLMEAAVASGKFAANAIFEDEGLRTEPIPFVDPKGPLA